MKEQDKMGKAGKFRKIIKKFYSLGKAVERHISIMMLDQCQFLRFVLRFVFLVQLMATLVDVHRQPKRLACLVLLSLEKGVVARTWRERSEERRVAVVGGDRAGTVEHLHNHRITAG